MQHINEVLRKFDKYNDNEEIDILMKSRQDKDSKIKIRKYFERKGIKVIEYKIIPYVYIKIKAGELRKTVYSMKKNNENILNLIEDIEESHQVKATKYKLEKIVDKVELWGMDAIRRGKARRILTERNNYNVGVIDTGIDYNHNELKERFGIVKGYDFINENNKPMDLNGHGTHVAGTIAGKEVGVSDNATLYALRVLDENGSGSEANVMRAIEWALENDEGIKINAVNLSLGAPNASEAFKDLCEIAVRRGLNIIAAAGNEEYGYEYPAAFKGVISVAAVNEDLEHAYFSNIADTNIISAPGVDIISAFPNNKYAVLSGTSMATPHITGTAALCELRENLENLLSKTSQRLNNTTEEPYKDVFGYGLIRADRIATLKMSEAYEESRIKEEYERFVKQVLSLEF